VHSGRENYLLVSPPGFLDNSAYPNHIALDELSQELYKLGYQGQLIFGLLIFVTTIPPLPLYSTLMVLCGYTFGVWEGFVVSYIASLTGAIVVFIVSRTLLRDVITKRCVPQAVGAAKEDSADVQPSELANGNLATPHHPLEPPPPTPHSDSAIPVQPP
jgi:heme exporter protein D